MADRKYVYRFDSFVNVEADSLEEAQEALAEVEEAVVAVPKCSLAIFDAYAVEDAETGEEIRALG